MSASISRQVGSVPCARRGLLACAKARTVIAGTAGGLALSVAMLLTFRLIGFGWNADGLLLQSAWQSPKLIAVWTELAPLPRIIAQPAGMILGLVLFGIGHAVVYRWLSPAWPKRVWSRGWRFSLLALGMTYSFWEFFTPFNLLGEPLPLIALELAFWTIVAFSEGCVLAAVSEWLDEAAAAGRTVA